MPRWACRIALDVVGIRVERLQDISEEDAKAEGAQNKNDFVTLWDSINGKRDGCSWNDNPWVWVVEFEKQ